jgi:hypothetical protein
MEKVKQRVGSHFMDDDDEYHLLSISAILWRLNLFSKFDPNMLDPQNPLVSPRSGRRKPPQIEVQIEL